jgi:hypothetical protein
MCAATWDSAVPSFYSLKVLVTTDGDSCCSPASDACFARIDGATNISIRTPVPLTNVRNCPLYLRMPRNKYLNMYVLLKASAGL